MLIESILFFLLPPAWALLSIIIFVLSLFVSLTAYRHRRTYQSSIKLSLWVDPLEQQQQQSDTSFQKLERRSMFKEVFDGFTICQMHFSHPADKKPPIWCVLFHNHFILPAGTIIIHNNQTPNRVIKFFTFLMEFTGIIHKLPVPQEGQRFQAFSFSTSVPCKVPFKV